MYFVKVQNKDGESVRFGFNKLSDAMNFVEICVECGDDGTMVMISYSKED